MKKRYKLPIAKKGEWPNGSVIQVIDDKSLDAIVRNTMTSLGKTGRVLCDFDHLSEMSPDIKKALEKMGVQMPTNASGWINNLYRDGDTVWGDMQSTPEGEEAIDSETYCKTSPTFRIIDCETIGNRGGKTLLRPLKLKSVALTNLPAMASLGSVMANREMILNKEDDLQSVFIGSAMDILEKGKNMENEKEVIVNATPVEVQAEPVKEDAKPVDAPASEPTVEEVKASALEDVNGQVGIIAEAQGLSTESAQVVADVAVSVATDAVEAVETAVEEAQPVEAPKAADAPNAEIETLKAKIAELEAVIAEAQKAKDAEALQNRINEELAKYPTLQNREEAGELLKNNWDLGTRFLSTMKISVVSAPASKVIQNRVPAKSPEADLSAMSKHERLRYKMFGR